MNRAEYRQRRETLAARIALQKVDALLITHLPNVRYLTGFTGSNGTLLLTPDRATLFTDPRYATQSRQETDCKVRVVKGPTFKGIAAALKRVRRTGFEPRYLTCDLLAKYKESTRMKPAALLVDEQRQVKSAAEIELIRRSVEINSRAYDAAIRRIRPGRDTEMDLAGEIEFQQRKHGAEKPAFETIVASGRHGALPHARPGKALIASNALLLIDMGALSEGYASDMTRVVFLGKPSGQAVRYYQAVLTAQLAAIDTVKAGVKTARVDRVARETLRRFRLDKLFTHSTGHGLGLEIHEAPSLRKADKSVLKPGMAITIEPGIYREDFGGIRIEDTVLVTETGCEVLTPTPKDLTVL